MSDNQNPGGNLNPLPTPEEGIREFAREVSRDRAQAKAYSSTHNQTRGKVESHTTSTPMSPAGFQSPVKRQFTNTPIFPSQHKPFSFALERGDGGALCYFGSLIWSVTRAQARSYGFGEGTSVAREAIMRPLSYPATNLNTVDNWSFMPTQLGWFGDVFLQWECNEAGTVDPASVQVVGPGTPADNPIPAYDSGDDEPVPAGTYTYYVKIGNVPSSGPVTQELSGDVYWHIHLLRGEAV